MSKIHEGEVASFLSDKLNLKFENSKFKLNGWGEEDDWAQLDNGVFVFLEVETSQKHPNTNVLKVMPYLDENKATRIFLIQTFFPDSPGLNSNRGKLGEWTANKFKNILGKRFDYYKLVITDNITAQELADLKNKIATWKTK